MPARSNGPCWLTLDEDDEFVPFEQRTEAAQEWIVRDHLTGPQTFGCRDGSAADAAERIRILFGCEAYPTGVGACDFRDSSADLEGLSAAVPWLGRGPN